MTITVSDKARDLILSFEGLDQADWPGANSGVTIGHGYDLGFHTRDEFIRDWGPYLSAIDTAKLAACVGKRGVEAREMARVLRGQIEITPGLADQVFSACSLPRYAALTEKAFPGVETLPQDAQGALVSLVFNRGGSLDDNDSAIRDRYEMRMIHIVVGTFADSAKTPNDLATALRLIAQNLRTMRRLWVWHEDADSWRQIIPDLPFRIIEPPAKPTRGLQLRREQEARLVESCGVAA